jgi:hypothetical protein
LWRRRWVVGGLWRRRWVVGGWRSRGWVVGGWRRRGWVVGGLACLLCFPQLAFVSAILCSPNEDFGRLNEPIDETFRSTFQGCEYLIWATNRWKVNRKDSSNVSFSPPKSSFGEHKFCIIKASLKPSQYPAITHVFQARVSTTI